MHSLLLGLLLATAAVADGGAVAGRPAAPCVSKPADAGVARAADAGTEQYQSEAWDTRRPLAQRLESALRAATLAPQDTAARKLLGELFYERQLELAAADKATTIRKFSRICEQESDESCLSGAVAMYFTDVLLWPAVRDGHFVVAVGVPERVVVYRGRYRFPQDRKDSKGYLFQGELSAVESFKPTPVLEEALFSLGGGRNRAGTDLLEALPFGRYFLDAPSQSLLQPLPRQWSRLEEAPEVRSFSKAFKKGPVFKMWWNCPESRPVLMRLEVDIHGRWMLGIPQEGTFWIAAVEKTDGGLQLKLVMEEETWVEDGQRSRHKQETVTRQVLFKLPPENGDIAYLGDVPYSTRLSGYPHKPHPACD